jgi:transcription termination factor Rho
MGFADRLKDLKKQAQEAVVEHKDQIQQAVDTVGVLANEKTGGKYATKISKIHDHASTAVEKAATDGSDGAAAGAPVTSFDAQADAVADAPPAADAPPVAPTPPTGEAPSFADEAPVADAAPPADAPPAPNPSHSAPDFDS